MGSKPRLSSYCTKRGDNAVNLVTSRKTNAILARPITNKLASFQRLEEASGFFTILTHGHVEGKSSMYIRGLPTQSTTVSDHKFGDRVYDDDIHAECSFTFMNIL